MNCRINRSNLQQGFVSARILVSNSRNYAIQTLFSFAFSYRSSAYYRGGSGPAELVRSEGSE
jgi:hypothetical protein